MAVDDVLLAFPDEEDAREQKRQREQALRLQTEEKLQSMGLDLLNRWDELRMEEIGAEGIASALGAPPHAADEVPVAQPAAHIRAATRAVPDAILTFTADGCVRSANAGAIRMFGYSAEAMLNKSIAVLLPTATALIEALAATDAALQDAPSSTEGIGLTCEGREIEVEISVGVTQIEDVRYHAAVVRDISERNRARRELERLNVSLQDQVQETEAALARLHEAQQQLVQAEKMASLGLLVAGVAHEINTPIGIAVTAASYLGDQAAALGDAMKSGGLRKSQLEAAISTFGESSSIILSNLQRAATLVQSFKQVAVDQGSEEWRRIDLSHYLVELLHSLHPQIKPTPHRLALYCEEGLCLHTAPGALAQIISNLVMNSLIHAWPQGQPGVMQLAARIEAGSLHLRYSDDGLGISPELLPLIFDPFYTTRRGDGGSGLGLHIVFNLVSQTLRGSIRAHSAPGEGLSFDIVLPIPPETMQ